MTTATAICARVDSRLVLRVVSDAETRDLVRLDLNSSRDAPPADAEDRLIEHGWVISPSRTWRPVEAFPGTWSVPVVPAAVGMARLRAELEAARALAADATEYRVMVPEAGGQELRVRRQSWEHGDGWSVTVPRHGGGAAWTQEGWQESISALTVDRLYCWPDAPTAIREGRTALQPAAGTA